MDDLLMDIEEFGSMLTHLLKVVSPGIDKQRTFEHVMDMLARDLTVDTVTRAGMFIKATANESSGVH